MNLLEDIETFLKENEAYLNNDQHRTLYGKTKTKLKPYKPKDETIKKRVDAFDVSDFFNAINRRYIVRDSKHDSDFNLSTFIEFPKAKLKTMDKSKKERLKQLMIDKIQKTKKVTFHILFSKYHFSKAMAIKSVAEKGAIDEKRIVSNERIEEVLGLYKELGIIIIEDLFENKERIELTIPILFTIATIQETHLTPHLYPFQKLLDSRSGYVYFEDPLKAKEIVIEQFRKHNVDLSSIGIWRLTCFIHLYTKESFIPIQNFHKQRLSKAFAEHVNFFNKTSTKVQKEKMISKIHHLYKELYELDYLSKKTK